MRLRKLCGGLQDEARRWIRPACSSRCDRTDCSAHVDVDTYQCAKDTVDWPLPRMPIGAKIVFDDYGFRAAKVSRA